MNNVTAATVAQIIQEAFVPKETIGVGPGEKDPQVRLEDSLKRLEMVDQGPSPGISAAA